MTDTEKQILAHIAKTIENRLNDMDDINLVWKDRIGAKHGIRVEVAKLKSMSK
jgi:hypothetical protein